MNKAKAVVILVAVVGLGILAGCAGNQGLIQGINNSSRQDVFQELTANAPISSGYADLQVVSSLKTHLPGAFSERDLHGTPEYKMLVNIDGQTAQLAGSPFQEKRGKQSLQDPEEGQGVRYTFQKSLRLKAGTHRIFVSLPFDDVAVERQITLKEGSINTLVLEPIYMSVNEKRRPGFYSTVSFKEGIKGFQIKLNDKSL